MRYETTRRNFTVYICELYTSSQKVRERRRANNRGGGGWDSRSSPKTEVLYIVLPPSQDPVTTMFQHASDRLYIHQLSSTRPLAHQTRNVWLNFVLSHEPVTQPGLVSHTGSPRLPLSRAFSRPSATFGFEGEHPYQSFTGPQGHQRLDQPVRCSLQARAILIGPSRSASEAREREGQEAVPWGRDPGAVRHGSAPDWEGGPEATCGGIGLCRVSTGIGSSGVHLVRCTGLIMQLGSPSPTSCRSANLQYRSPHAGNESVS